MTVYNLKVTLFDEGGVDEGVEIEILGNHIDIPCVECGKNLEINRITGATVWLVSEFLAKELEVRCSQCLP